MAVDVCNVDSILAAESGRISEMVAAKAIMTSPWNRLVKQAEFPTGLGSTLQTLIYQRTTVPDVSSAAWSDVNFNSGDGTTCNPTPQQINYAFSYKSYNLQQLAVKSPVLCVNDLRYGWQVREQLSEQFRVLSENTTWIWENRYRDEFLRLSGNHIVLDSLDPYSASSSGSDQDFPAVEPITTLQQGYLDAYWLQLARDNATGEYAKIDGQKQFALIASPEIINALKKQNNDIRQDIRFSSEANTLLAPLGATWAYMNYIYIADMQVPRYTFTDGEYVRVPYYTTAAASEGNQAVVNPAYLTAPYEVAFIFNPEAYTSRVASAITSPGGNTKFDPVNYRGDFIWINNRDNNCNILGNQGFFYSESMQGSQPKRTEWAYSLLYKRTATCNYDVAICS